MLVKKSGIICRFCACLYCTREYGTYQDLHREATCPSSMGNRVGIRFGYAESLKLNLKLKLEVWNSTRGACVPHRVWRGIVSRAVPRETRVRAQT
jgi:hypothetical protein